MNEKFLNVRIPQKIDITENWNNSTLVLKKGEIGIEELSDGSYKFKWGNGINVWSELKYATGEALNHILDGIANGSIRTSLSTAESTEYKLGTAAFAEGQGTKASGNFSHAEGLNTTASGAYAHAEGRQTVASGSVSHAEGTDTVASGIRSHASGYGTIAKGENQTVVGKYNIQDDNNEYAFIVGNGSTTTPSNAFAIDWQGNVEANGKKLATEEFVNQNGGAIDTVKVNGQSLEINDKSVNIEVPTKTSELQNDSEYLTSVAVDGKINTAKSDLIGTDSDSLESNTIKGAKKYADVTSEGVLVDAKEYADTKIADVAALDNSISVENDNTNVSIGVKISQVEGNALSLAADGLKVITPAETDYTVNVTESSPEGYAKAYTITQVATGLNATINIPKDMVVQSGIVETKTESGPWGLAGTYLVLTLANTTSDRIYIDVSTLIEYVTSGSTENDAIQIVIDSTTHKVSASIKDGSITKDKLDTTIKDSLGKADAAAPQTSVNTLEGKVSTLEEGVNTNTTKLNTIAEGAQVNVQSDWNQVDDTKDDFIKNKPDLDIYAKSDLSNINDDVFKEKVEASGFSSGSQVQIVKWGADD